MTSNSNRVSKCKSCGTIITWLRTKRDKRMPVDGATKDFIFDQAKHISHWDTCPDAQKFRGETEAPLKAEPRKTPLPMLERMVRIRELARVLIQEHGYSEAVLQSLSLEVTGVSRWVHLSCTSQQTLDKLIAKLQALIPEHSEV